MIRQEPLNQSPRLPVFPARKSTAGDCPSTLSRIYDADVNLSVWHRELDSSVVCASDFLLEQNPTCQLSLVTSESSVSDALCWELGAETELLPLVQDIEKTVEMFSCLFDLSQVGLRLAVLSGVMCPRFHVDQVPCRLVTTYVGVGTEWIENGDADRSKLGAGSQGLEDEQSGLYQSPQTIQQLSTGDVALLKGERWEGNRGGGLIHRSPGPQKNKKRLLMTLDWVAD